jgi:hypothetical protein
MRAVVVDPRDVTWGVDAVRYRVTFWEPGAGGWVAEEYEVSDGDLAEVLAWAQERTPRAGMCTIGVLLDSAEGRGLVRLSGRDPTRGAASGTFLAPP